MGSGEDVRECSVTQHTLSVQPISIYSERKSKGQITFIVPYYLPGIYLFKLGIISSVLLEMTR